MTIKEIKGGIVAPKGFKTAGVPCGLKTDASKRDLALIVSDVPAVAAGVFTKNVVHAHCVALNRQTLKHPTARAIVVNAGNANACNGPQGMTDAKSMVSQTAQAIGASDSEVFCASTGVIGHNMPMDKIANGIADAAKALHDGDGSDTAAAIMTTDLVSKEITVELDIGGKAVRIGAIAKGSGMIEPNMATMLGFITTDVAIEKSVLQTLFAEVIDKTFNAITVDGDTSTNDMCIVLANGQAGNPQITDANGAQAKQFQQALHHVCEHLAKAIARDGEGATKLVEIIVKNCPEAKRVAKIIANSPLVKTALYGNDPNWGRLMMAAGRSYAAFDPSRIDIDLAGIRVFEKGASVPFDPAAASKKMNAKDVQIVLDMHMEGGETAKVWTCDFSYDYVKINADYHT